MLLRTFLALKLCNLAGRLVGNRPVSVAEQVRAMQDALGEITILLPAEHPACQVALVALAADQGISR